MRTATKLILANGLLSIAILVAYAHFSLGSFQDQEAGQAHKELESCIQTFWELLRHKGTDFRIVDGRFLAGSYVVNGNYELPDKVQQIFGGVATIFMRDSRVSTNVLKTDGSRAIGTKLSGPAYQAVFGEGKPYRGEASILGIPYLTAYDPIRDKNGEIIGVLFVGMKKSAFLTRINEMRGHLSLFLLGTVAILALFTGKIYRMTKRLEQINEAQKDFAESLVRNSTAATFVLDSEHRVIIWNRACEELTGVKAAEVVGTDGAWKAFYEENRLVLADFIINGNQSDIASHYNSSADCALIPEGFRAERWFEDPNGRRRYIQFHAAPLRDTKGKLIAAIQTIEDISEHKNSEDAIKKAYSLLSATLDATADGILVRDLAGNLTSYNRKFAEVWALPEPILATRYDAAVRAYACGQLKDPHKFLELTEQSYLLRHEETCDILEFKDGRIVERVSKPQYIGSEVVGRVISFRDITERTRVERAHRESEERYRSLIENINLGITLIDENFRIVMTNGYAAKMLNKPEGSLVQKECFREFEGRDAVCPHCAGKKSLETGKTAAMETEGIRADGSRIQVKVHTFPIFNADGKATQFIEVVQDITDQKRAEEERAIMEAQLRQSQKMDAIGQLAGGIAHDFNNMLGVILGHTQLALARLEPHHTLYKDLLQIEKAGQRSAELTRQLLGYSRKQAVLPVIVNLDEVIVDHQKMLSRLIGEEVDFKFVPAGDLWNIRIDPSQIDQILTNLAVNSRDAIEGVGTVAIATANVTLDETAGGRLHLSPGDYVLLTFSDTGFGMDAETVERIFEPFFTTKGEGKGTGLGLSTVYGIVKQNEGAIHVQSNPGRGTTFTIHFPRVRAAVAEPAEKRQPPPRAGTETVLVVEDEEQILDLVKSVLEEFGYNILTAVTPEDACLICETYPADIHLLVTDVVMPIMNGRELQARIERIKPGIRVLFMSGYTADIVAHRGITDERVNFIAKPFSVNALTEKVRAVLGS